MIDYKRMDEKDFVFLNRPLNEKEERDFSEFLQSRKKKARLLRGGKNRKEALKDDGSNARCDK